VINCGSWSVRNPNPQSITGKAAHQPGVLVVDGRERELVTGADPGEELEIRLPGIHGEQATPTAPAGTRSRVTQPEQPEADLDTDARS
jgi:hypothetical protein